MNYIFYILLFTLSGNCLLWSFIKLHIVSAHKGNHYYKRNKTIYWFSIVFMLMTLTIIYFGYKVDLKQVSILGIILLSLLSFIASITSTVYIMQLKIFKEKMIPKKKVNQIVKDKELNLAIEIVDRIDNMKDDGKLKDDAIRQVENALTNLKLKRRLKKATKTNNYATNK